MLASTVQFSNNDQSHTLNDPKTTSSEAGNLETTTTRPLPQDPTTCPTQSIPDRVPRRSSTNDPISSCAE